MNLRILLVLLATIVFVSGCATTSRTPIVLNEGFWQQEEKKVGVVMTTIPELNVYLPGANCLLCIAAAEAANSKLSAHVARLSIEDLPKMKELLANQLIEKGVHVSVIKQPLELSELPKYKYSAENAAKKDFTGFNKTNKITHLLVIDLTMLGMHRTYSSYIPTRDPKGVFAGSTYLVNLDTNTYESYTPIKVFKSVDDNWKEPPNYPGLTNAFYQALETGKATILSAFAK